jgi:hypothetical protein
MAATVEICESNGAGETITHNITNSNMGSTDAVNLVAATHPITPGNRSFIKYQRLHVTDMGGSSKVDTLKVWRGGSLAGSDTHVTNARETSYGGALTYATPTASSVSGVDQTMPTTEPSGANLGIGGSLSGEITAAGYSDYLGHQLVINAGTTAGVSLTGSNGVNYKYREVA